MRLNTIISRIEPIDEKIMEEARRHTAKLCMPPRALGRLHELAERLCGIGRTLKPSVGKKGFMVMAGDHGVARHGVSAFPQAVTGEMVKNFVRGGAGINALARQLPARVMVVDMGIIPDLPDDTLKGENRLVKKRIAAGTNDFTLGPAMSRDQAKEAVLAGFDLASAMLTGADGLTGADMLTETDMLTGADTPTREGVAIIGTGDMGIGNTTASSAVCAIITGLPVEQVTGYGTGISEDSFQNKCRIIKKALAVNAPDPADGLDVLSRVGGFEIGGIAGLVLAAAYHKKPVVIDGFISAAGALIAYTLCPTVAQYAFAGHCSVEQGHKHMLAHMGLEPLINLGLRLGEGTGAALAMHLIEAACHIFNDVLTFGQAEVSKADGSKAEVSGGEGSNTGVSGTGVSV